MIELESIYADKLIHGSHLDRYELQTALKQILQTFTEKDFLSVFCARYGYEELPYSNNVCVDYIIDLDTHLLIKPKY